MIDLKTLQEVFEKYKFGKIRVQALKKWATDMKHASSFISVSDDSPKEYLKGYDDVLEKIIDYCEGF